MKRFGWPAALSLGMLLAAAGAGPIAAGGQPAGKAGDGIAEATAELGTPRQRRLIEALKKLRWDDPRERFDGPIKQLAATGDSVIPLVMAEFRLRRGSNPFRGSMVSVLESLKSERARQELLAIACAKKSDPLHSIFTDSAAWAFLRGARTPDESKALLAADDRRVIVMALHRSPTWNVYHAPLRKRLRELLQSTRREIRMAAAYAMGWDRDQRAAAGNVPLLLKMEATARKRGGPDARVGHGGCTLAELESQRYITTLAALPGAPESLGRVNTDDPFQKKAMILARFLNGEKNLREKVHQLLRDPQTHVLLRRYGAFVLGHKGGREDLALLEHLATADPTGRTPYFVRPPPRPWKAYPVRRAAKEAIYRVQERLRRPQSRPAPPPRPRTGTRPEPK